MKEHLGVRDKDPISRIGSRHRGRDNFGFGGMITKAKLVDRATGVILWECEMSPNVIVNGARTVIGGIVWAATSKFAGIFMGLISGTPTPAATDTISSHAGWTEITDYDEAVRETFVLAAVGSPGDVDNSASPAEFNWTSGAGAAVGGVMVATVNTKGESASQLIAAAAFSGGNVTPGAGQFLQVTYGYNWS